VTSIARAFSGLKVPPRTFKRSLMFSMRACTRTWPIVPVSITHLTNRASSLTHYNPAQSNGDLRLLQIGAAGIFQPRISSGGRMAAIQVSCPACRQQFLKTEGEPAACPRCGHVIATAAEAAPALPAAEPVVPPPLPPGLPPVPRWYVLRDGRRTGPFDWAQMQRMVVAGQVQP